MIDILSILTYTVQSETYRDHRDRHIVYIDIYSTVRHTMITVIDILSKLTYTVWSETYRDHRDKHIVGDSEKD